MLPPGTLILPPGKVIFEKCIGGYKENVLGRREWPVTFS